MERLTPRRGPGGPESARAGSASPPGGHAGSGEAADRSARGASPRDEPLEPCLRCGIPLPPRRFGCKGGHCPNCGHPYPHGDCSD